MILSTLEMEQFRGFTRRTVLEFEPQFTLIVGENGVGKTSVLWALRVLLSHTLKVLVKKSGKTLAFKTDDIARGKRGQQDWPFLRAESTIMLSQPDTPLVKCVVQKNAGSFALNTESDGRPREHAVDTPDRYEVTPITFANRFSAKEDPTPLAVYYSAHRSLALERSASRARAAGGPGAAYAEALEDRDLRLGEAILLWRKEEALEQSDGLPARANQAISRALPAFLGKFSNLRIEGDDKPRLVVDKLGTKLDLSQLSDGERGILAVLMDLTRRLSQANPTLRHPARDGRAVVLIDELDLHMHPRWQREIVSRLTEAFPKCQFIATTHSPAIISEVQPESLFLLRQDGDDIVPQRCGQAYGLDASYVMEHIMGTAPRPAPATDAINSIEDALESGNLDLARSKLAELRALLHGDDAVVVGLEATINNLEALGNAANQEEK